MGKPIFEPEKIPFVAEKYALTYQLEIQGKPVTISALSMGNPHAVRVVQDIENAPVDAEGALIETHPRFPKRVNVGYMQVTDRNHIKLLKDLSSDGQRKLMSIEAQSICPVPNVSQVSLGKNKDDEATLTTLKALASIQPDACVLGHLLETTNMAGQMIKLARQMLVIASDKVGQPSAR